MGGLRRTSKNFSIITFRQTLDSPEGPIITEVAAALGKALSYGGSTHTEFFGKF
jgi:hypothetical protein